MTNLAASDRTGTRRRNSGAHKPTRSLNEARIDVGGVDERSWDEIVRTHSARVYRLAYRLTGNQHDAEDLTQEVFIRVFRSLHTHTPATFEGWLCRITTHIFLDDIRRTTRLLTVTVGTWAEELTSPAPGPEQIFADHLLDSDVQIALNALPADFRIAVVLSDIEDLGHDQIAAILGIQLGTVRSRLYRGRTQLRAMLAERGPRPRATSQLTPARGIET